MQNRLNKKPNDTVSFRAQEAQVVTTVTVDLSGFDALDPAAAVALKEPTADLSALTPAAAAAVSGWTVKQFLKSSQCGLNSLTLDNQQNLDTLWTGPYPTRSKHAGLGTS